ncbi:unnamed protein product [Alternaria sp. RS040]
MKFEERTFRSIDLVSEEITPNLLALGQVIPASQLNGSEEPVIYSSPGKPKFQMKNRVASPYDVLSPPDFIVFSALIL